MGNIHKKGTEDKRQEKARISVSNLRDLCLQHLANFLSGVNYVKLAYTAELLRIKGHAQGPRGCSIAEMGFEHRTIQSALQHPYHCASNLLRDSDRLWVH